MPPPRSGIPLFQNRIRTVATLLSVMLAVKNSVPGVKHCGSTAVPLLSETHKDFGEDCLAPGPRPGAWRSSSNGEIHSGRWHTLTRRPIGRVDEEVSAGQGGNGMTSGC